MALGIFPPQKTLCLLGVKTRIFGNQHKDESKRIDFAIFL